jgi:hypothetical protein
VRVSRFPSQWFFDGLHGLTPMSIVKCESCVESRLILAKPSYLLGFR